MKGRGGIIITGDLIQNYRGAERILLRGENYIYLLAHPALRNWISNYTVTIPEGMMSNQYTVMPHASATLVFSWGESGISANLFGPITRPVTVGEEANASGLLFIVEFQPAGYYAFSGMPQKELTDLIIPFENINPVLVRQAIQMMETAEDIQSLIAGADRIFLEYLNAVNYRQEFWNANQMIIKSGGLISVKDISQNVYFSERHLNRIYDKYMGVSIKAFSRLVRVNRALRLLKRPSLSVQQVGRLTGFYDLSHFLHDFKQINGVTPQEYRDNMSDFYSEIAKY